MAALSRIWYTSLFWCYLYHDHSPLITTALRNVIQLYHLIIIWILSIEVWLTFWLTLYSVFVSSLAKVSSPLYLRPTYYPLSKLAFVHYQLVKLNCPSRDTFAQLIHWLISFIIIFGSLSTDEKLFIDKVVI